MPLSLTVTVCELRTSALEEDWAGLVEHVRERDSDLVLLPEMGLAPWFASGRTFDGGAWRAAVEAHAAWMARLEEDLAPAAVLGSRPVEVAGERRNAAFRLDDRGEAHVHEKSYLPDEEGFWEASWYGRGDGRFDLAEVGGAAVGFLVCTEMWFMQRAREYGEQGAHLIATPRCTPAETLDKWLAGGRACAVVAGAYSISSNHGDDAFGGLGWIVDPDGEVLATTSRGEPYVSAEVDLRVAEAAKRAYPRYVPEIVSGSPAR